MRKLLFYLVFIFMIGCSSITIDSHVNMKNIGPIDTFYINPLKVKGIHGKDIPRSFGRSLAFGLRSMNYRCYYEKEEIKYQYPYHLNMEIFHTDIGSEFDRESSVLIFIEIMNIKQKKIFFEMRISMAGIDIRDAREQAALCRTIAKTIDTKIKEKSLQ